VLDHLQVHLIQFDKFKCFRESQKILSRIFKITKIWLKILFFKKMNFFIYQEINLNFNSQFKSKTLPFLILSYRIKFHLLRMLLTCIKVDKKLYVHNSKSILVLCVAFLEKFWEVFQNFILHAFKINRVVSGWEFEN
jgi:hypothetical protein